MDTIMLSLSTVASGLAIHCLKLFCEKQLFPWIVTKYLNMNSNTYNTHQFIKSLWALVFHLSTFVVVSMIVISSDFWASVINPFHETHGTTLFWKNPAPPSKATGLFGVSFIGYYIVDLIYEQFISQPKDYVARGLHHLVTVFIGTMAYLVPMWWKFGLAVLFVHGICDIPLYLTKVLHYAELRNISDVLFVVQFFICICTRLILFPRYCYSLIVDVDQIEAITVTWPITPQLVVSSMLLVVHCVWTYRMGRVIRKAHVNKVQFPHTCRRRSSLHEMMLTGNVNYI
eukprot:18247_1